LPRLAFNFHQCENHFWLSGFFITFLWGFFACFSGGNRVFNLPRDLSFFQSVVKNHLLGVFCNQISFGLVFFKPYLIDFICVKSGKAFSLHEACLSLMDLFQGY